MNKNIESACVDIKDLSYTRLDYLAEKLEKQRMQRN